MDDPDFTFITPKGTEKNCAWVGKRLKRVNKLCVSTHRRFNADVFQNCPEACSKSPSVSYQNTAGHTFTLKNGNERNCEWIISNDKQMETRVNKFCAKEEQLLSCAQTCACTGDEAEAGAAASTSTPTISPSAAPTSSPTGVTPTTSPSRPPSPMPSPFPTMTPTSSPSDSPSMQPSVVPSLSQVPSASPTGKPSISSKPSPLHSSEPSQLPSSSPSNSPSALPSLEPSLLPSSSPSDHPSALPSFKPTNRPSETPTRSIKPSPSPSAAPFAPTTSPSKAPTKTPSSSPTMCVDKRAFTFNVNGSEQDCKWLCKNSNVQNTNKRQFMYCSGDVLSNCCHACNASAGCDENANWDS
ncbi:hypothetical protein CTEN210_16167 [Chaetoceros tenuissimus]|nr:hypothetical protein CTEN210_16167 [Chaetoceros tenuissimus]